MYILYNQTEDDLSKIKKLRNCVMTEKTENSSTVFLKAEPQFGEERKTKTEVSEV